MGDVFQELSWEPPHTSVSWRSWAHGEWKGRDATVQGPEKNAATPCSGKLRIRTEGPEPGQASIEGYTHSIMGGCYVYVVLLASATHTSISLGCVHRGSGSRIRSGGRIRTGCSGLHMQYVDKVLAPTLAKCKTPDIEIKQTKYGCGQTSVKN